MNENRCVCCGDIIPEGRMVCPKCYEKEWMIGQLSKSSSGCFNFGKIIKAIRGIFCTVSCIFSSAMWGWLYNRVIDDTPPSE